MKSLKCSEKWKCEILQLQFTEQTRGRRLKAPQRLLNGPRADLRPVSLCCQSHDHEKFRSKFLKSQNLNKI